LPTTKIVSNHLAEQLVERHLYKRSAEQERRHAEMEILVEQVKIAQPELWEALKATQAFHHKTRDWLGDLVAISNEAKHERLHFPTNDKIEEWMDQQLKSGDEVGELDLLAGKRFYPWSFSAIPGIDHDASVSLFDRLHQGGILDNKGEIPKKKGNSSQGSMTKIAIISGIEPPLQTEIAAQVVDLLKIAEERNKHAKEIESRLIGALKLLRLVLSEGKKVCLALASATVSITPSFLLSTSSSSSVSTLSSSSSSSFSSPSSSSSFSSPSSSSSFSSPSSSSSSSSSPSLPLLLLLLLLHHLHHLLLLLLHLIHHYFHHYLHFHFHFHLHLHLPLLLLLFLLFCTHLPAFESTF
jgi:hypothetical protein